MIIITDIEYNHMDDCARMDVMSGDTVRQTLKKIRAEQWGDMGTGRFYLSDYTYINVELQKSEGCELLSSQRAVRVEHVKGRDLIIHNYGRV